MISIIIITGLKSCPEIPEILQMSWNCPEIRNCREILLVWSECPEIDLCYAVVMLS